MLIEMKWNDCKHNKFSKLIVIWLQWIQYKPLNCKSESYQMVYKDFVALESIEPLSLTIKFYSKP